MNSLHKLSVDDSTDEDGNGDTEDDGVADDDEAQHITLASTSLDPSSNLLARQTTVTPITHTSSISSTDSNGASTQPSVITKTTIVMGHAKKRQADASPSEEPKPKRYHESARCPAPKLAAMSSFTKAFEEDLAR